MELEGGLPKLVLNFGSPSPVVLALSADANDFAWHELAVKRVGRKATIKMTKPNSEEIADEQIIIIPGAKTILNLFDDSRRLFIGSVPAGFKVCLNSKTFSLFNQKREELLFIMWFQMPSSLQQQSFVGDIDKLRINGEQIGFWNSERSVQVTGAEMRPLLDSERNEESGVTFNGIQGYMQLDVGAWNPRKRTAILLSFMTYSPDGLFPFYASIEPQASNPQKCCNFKDFSSSSERTETS